MNDAVKIALIIAAAIILSVGLWLYFSPYQQCVRARAELNASSLLYDFTPDEAAQMAKSECANASE